MASVDDSMRHLIESEQCHPRLKEILRYALGLDGASGKRTRSTLCLTIVRMYDAGETSLDAALAIELFHEFTLMHDDIEDASDSRRNKPAVWKAFGIAEAINAGDCLCALAHRMAARSLARDVLLSAFSEVLAGQHVDIMLSSDASLTQDDCIKSVEQKTGALFGAAAESAGVSAGASEQDCRTLRAFGRALGIAYQLIDDVQDMEEDLHGLKRTLPFYLSGASAFTKESVPATLPFIETSGALSKTMDMARSYAKQAKDLIAALSLVEPNRERLRAVVDMILT
jgi:geranylgeranyl diphosphate synthase type I